MRDSEIYFKDNRTKVILTTKLDGNNMNLEELDELIKSIPADDMEMINFYKQKRIELVADISKEVQAILNNPQI